MLSIVEKTSFAEEQIASAISCSEIGRVAHISFIRAELLLQASHRLAGRKS
jgi:hypothetical protein